MNCQVPCKDWRTPIAFKDHLSFLIRAISFANWPNLVAPSHWVPELFRFLVGLVVGFPYLTHKFKC